MRKNNLKRFEKMSKNNKKLTNSQAIAAIALVNEGHTHREVASILGVSVSTVSRIKNKSFKSQTERGMPYTGRAPFPKEMKDAVIKCLKKGMTHKDIADKFKVSGGYVGRVARSIGVRTVDRMTDEQIEKAIKLRKQGKTLQEIADAVGFSICTISKKVRGVYPHGAGPGIAAPEKIRNQQPAPAVQATPQPSEISLFWGLITIKIKS